MVRLVWRMYQVLTLNSHIVSSPVYDDFVIIGQLEDHPPGIQRREDVRRDTNAWMDASFQWASRLVRGFLQCSYLSLFRRGQAIAIYE
jgi:hypothetical protein